MRTVEPTVTTSGLTMAVEAVTHAIQWLASQLDAQIALAMILSDTMNLLLSLTELMGSLFVGWLLNVPAT